MAKFNATVSIEKNIWTDFKQLCIKRSTNATAEITRFIELSLDEATYEVNEHPPQAVRTIINCVEGELLSYFDHRFDMLKDEIEKLKDTGTVRVDTGSIDSLVNKEVSTTDNTLSLQDDTEKTINTEATRVDTGNSNKSISTTRVDTDSDTDKNVALDNEDANTEVTQVDTENKEKSNKSKQSVRVEMGEKLSDLEVANKTGISEAVLKKIRSSGKTPKSLKNKLRSYEPTENGWIFFLEDRDGLEKEVANGLNDKQFKQTTQIKSHITTIGRWRRGKLRIPESVSKDWKVIDGLWYRR